jgi:energy-coupling factor transport system ATP-binding protein
MIEFCNVDYVHPNGVIALKNINLKIKKGEVTAIVGENGAGKTTLIKHSNGLLKPVNGQVLVFGKDTRKESVAHLSKMVGIVFQNPDHQLFSESVEKEIRFGLENFGFKEDIIAKRLDWALETFDLEKYRSKSPMLLSGGEKKRLCFAAVLSWDPDVIILDEPTVGQDFYQKELLTQNIKMLASQGKTILVVSHDIEFIWPLQPRIVVMRGGRIIAEGHSKKIFQNLDILSKARLVKPQLQELTDMLKVKPSNTFSNIYEAKRFLIENWRID